jgi:hypothetical protein
MKYSEKKFIIPAPAGLFIPTIKKYSYIQGVIPTCKQIFMSR